MGCITTLLVESVALGKRHCRKTTHVPPKHEFNVANVFWISSLASLMSIVRKEKNGDGLEDEIKAVSCVGPGLEMYQVPDEIVTRLTKVKMRDLSRLAISWKEIETLFWDVTVEDLMAALSSLREASI